MNPSYKIFIFLFFSVLIAKSLNPNDIDKESSIIIKNNEKNYRYYELDKNGLDYSNLGEFSDEDSIRIKLFIRQIISEDNSKKQNFGIGLTLNNDIKKILFNDKKNAMRKIEDRPGWSCTDAGLWFIDIMYKDFEQLSIKQIDGSFIKKFTNDKLIIRSQVNRIDRARMIPSTVNTINLENKYKIDTKRERDQKLISRDWYRLLDNKDELQFEVIGPTSIRVFSRIGFPSTGNNDYHIFVKEDGLDIGTFYFTTELSSLSNLSDTGEKVSKWRTCWINVPKGKHYYTIRRGYALNSTVQYEANVLDLDTQIVDDYKPIYIRVKRYDEK